MPELPEIETVRNNAQARRWGRAEWGPFVLLAVLMVAAIVGNPIRDSLEEWQAGIFLGTMFCPFLQIAFWSAWSPYAAVWRLPLGFTACVTLSLTMCIEARDYTPIVMAILFFSTFYLSFATARALGRWRFLILGKHSIASTIAGRQFSVRYLLAWTTVCALLLTLGRYVLNGSDSVDRSPWELSLLLLTFSIIYGVILLPTIGIGLLVLGNKQRVLLSLLSFPIGIPLSSLTAAYAIQEWIPGGAPGGLFGAIWGLTACFSIGATLSMLLTALVLRYSGYRITRDTKATA